MPDDKHLDYYNAISAYALGCLDKQDFIDLVEFLESGENFQWQELGEVQNLTSLLPAFLNLEEVPPGLKDRVARKLYRLRDAKKPAPPPSADGKKMTRSIPTMIRMPEAAASDEAAHLAEPKSERPADAVRPKPDTQVRQRQSEQADRPAQPPEEQPFSLNIPQSDEPAEPVIPAKSEIEPPQYAPEEFIINQDGYSEAQTTPAANGEMHIHIDEPAPSQPPRSDKDIETIRQKVVEDVEREEHEHPAKEEKIIEGVSPLVFYTVSIFLIIGILAVYFILSGKIKTQSGEPPVAAEVNPDAAVNSLMQALQIDGGAFEILKSKTSQIVTLTNADKREYAKFLYDSKTKKGVLIFVKIEPNASEMKYQLWYELDRKYEKIGGPVDNTPGKYDISSVPVTLQKISEGGKFVLSLEAADSDPKEPSKVLFESE